MTHVIDPAELKRWLSDGAEIAFLDVREHGQFGEGHPFLAIPAPYSRLEIDVPRLVPRRTTRIALIDGGDGVAARAAEALRDIGYTDVSVSRDGVQGWQAAGFTLFKGVNLPSKTFGELVEHALETPHLSASELSHRLDAGETIVILDGRPLQEFHKMSIPGAICCPNGELARRFWDLDISPETPVIINCAGRTRSIIGAQTLIDIGVPNPVYALENGTQGWYLQDLPLNHGQSQTYRQIDTPPAEAVLTRAEALANKSGVERVDSRTLDGWAHDADRTVFILDVRSPQETAADPVPGAIPAPGGQLIQATDQYVGTRGARLVIVDTDGVRAPVVASWLRRLGHEAYVAARTDLPAASHADETLPLLPEVQPADLFANGEPPRLIDLRSSASFRQGHIEGAEWSIRPRLRPEPNQTVVFIADDPAVAAIAARDISAERGAAFRLAGGPQDWEQAGLRVVATPDTPADDDRIDFLFFVHDRHDGNKAAARQYLEWETGLVAQLDADERKLFRLPGIA
ncbi:rhodanese-like domain-containing protein [Pseudochelatococcus contaminans]|uniref:Rhodanese-related sulfurtransferase n=1 Tax=Pseudochelatococcus contaminans TaxID=1538103 RepID=A0A7W5Z6Q3_9HYPH|nr:rhodanese-like domain-containing protein [Pseudochelatococcus contaminans]MBB3810511.1 rhodanese-related sulfurtransferase [Pseudochelatococcus contaminans]